MMGIFTLLFSQPAKRAIRQCPSEFSHDLNFALTRDCNGLHLRRYLIAVSGLDDPFMGLAAIN